MAGTYEAFDPARFRDAIHFAMQMGLPPDQTLQPSFVFPPGAPSYFKNGEEVTNPRLDVEGHPLDPEISVVTPDPVTVQVKCAVEIVRANADEMPVGNFRPVRAVVTLLDQEYAQVRGCHHMTYNGDKYLFGYSPEALGMFDVGVHTMVFYALQET